MGADRYVELRKRGVSTPAILFDWSEGRDPLSREDYQKVAMWGIHYGAFPELGETQHGDEFLLKTFDDDISGCEYLYFKYHYENKTSFVQGEVEFEAYLDDDTGEWSVRRESEREILAKFGVVLE